MKLSVGRYLMSRTASGTGAVTSTRSSSRSSARATPHSAITTAMRSTHPSVVQPGAMSTTYEPSGLLNAYLLDGNGGARALDSEGVEPWAPRDGGPWGKLHYSG